MTRGDSFVEPRAITLLTQACVAGLVSVSKAAAVLGISNRSAATRLGFFARRGWAKRVRRGLYVISRNAQWDEVTGHDDAWVLGQEVFSPCYIGGWSAAEYWGLTEQFAMSTLIVTAANLRCNNATIAGHSFRLFKVPKERIEGAVPTIRHGTTTLISTRERTLIDCLRSPELCGGIGPLIAMLRTYSRQSNCDLSKLIEEAKTSANGATWKRLGYLVESEWPEMGHIKEIARQNISAGYSRLDPGNSERGRLIRRWRLCVNLPAMHEEDIEAS
jgi:predicted transcriptional regulator of viral defense system